MNILKKLDLIFYSILVVNFCVLILAAATYNFIGNARIFLNIEGVLIFVNLILFFIIKIYTFEKFKKSEKWAVLFYLDYLLFIPTWFFLPVFSMYIILILSPLFFLGMIIFYIVLLIKAYRQKPRLAYFWNLLAIILIAILPLLIGTILFIYYFSKHGF